MVPLLLILLTDLISHDVVSIVEKDLFCKTGGKNPLKK